MGGHKLHDILRYKHSHELQWCPNYIGLSHAAGGTSSGMFVYSYRSRGAVKKKLLHVHDTVP